MDDDGQDDDHGNRPDDNTRGWAERLLNKLTGERDAIISFAKEHESIAAALRGQAAELDEEISNLVSLLDR